MITFIHRFLLEFDLISLYLRYFRICIRSSIDSYSRRRLLNLFPLFFLPPSGFSRLIYCSFRRDAPFSTLYPAFAPIFSAVSYESDRIRTLGETITADRWGTGSYLQNIDLLYYSTPPFTPQLSASVAHFKSSSSSIANNRSYRRSTSRQRQEAVESATSLFDRAHHLILWKTLMLA